MWHSVSCATSRDNSSRERSATTASRRFSLWKKRRTVVGCTSTLKTGAGMVHSWQMSQKLGHNLKLARMHRSLWNYCFAARLGIKRFQGRQKGDGGATLVSKFTWKTSQSIPDEVFHRNNRQDHTNTAWTMPPPAHSKVKYTSKQKRDAKRNMQLKEESQSICQFQMQPQIVAWRLECSKMLTLRGAPSITR